MNLVDRFNVVKLDYDKICDLFEESQISERDELDKIVSSHFNHGIVAFYFIHTGCGVDLYYDFEYNIPLLSDPEDFDLYVSTGTLETAEIIPIVQTEHMIVDDVIQVCQRLESQSLTNLDPSQMTSSNSSQVNSSNNNHEKCHNDVEHSTSLIIMNVVEEEEPTSFGSNDNRTSEHTERNGDKGSNDGLSIVGTPTYSQEAQALRESTRSHSRLRRVFPARTSKRRSLSEEKIIFNFEQLKWKRRKLDDVQFMDVDYCTTNVFVTRSVTTALHLSREYSSFSCKLGDISFVCRTQDQKYARDLSMWLFSQIETGYLQIDK